MHVPALLSWYRARRRDLPWRREVSPYRTMVSELMLQQTRVDTVIPYFERFMGRFPSVEVLADAPMESVLEHWSGLGYYRRARNLHAAAVVVAERGAFPASAAELQELPGIGPYTAGAIASIAFGADAPVVDGNVERVLCRHDAMLDVGVARRDRLWARAAALLPAGEAGDFNQALMELGATVCTPTRPVCPDCPVASSCQGRDAPERYPVKQLKREVPSARAVAAIIEQEGSILLARRAEGGLLGGLWEPPGGPGQDLAGALQARLGVGATVGAPRGEVRHIFTHLRLTTQVFSAELLGDPRVDGVAYTELRVVPRTELVGVALSTLARKLLRAGGVPVGKAGS